LSRSLRTSPSSRFLTQLDLSWHTHLTRHNLLFKWHPTPFTSLLSRFMQVRQLSQGMPPNLSRVTERSQFSQASSPSQSRFKLSVSRFNQALSPSLSRVTEHSLAMSLRSQSTSPHSSQKKLSQILTPRPLSQTRNTNDFSILLQLNKTIDTIIF